MEMKEEKRPEEIGAEVENTCQLGLCKDLKVTHSNRRPERPPWEEGPWH